MDLQRNPHQLDSPVKFTVSFTASCPLACRHCYADCSREPDQRELTSGEWIAFLDQRIEAGAISILFEGGEPLARGDFLDVLAHCSDKALTRLRTNGWLRDNGFVNDTLRLGGRPAPMGAIEIPTLAVIAERDDIVPEAATAPIVDMLTGTKTELLRLDAGHASLTSGRKAVKVLLPQVFDWLARHSEEIA